ncbi:ADP-ribosylation factor-like protein 4C [Eriocheir sinensis]|uniref:ADP-ribosylation factor-like protein 4C n=1 Tax=Eriocheir sinensis TaxID=95602 RepID=UPI0021C9747D|nr:ADP-ribosylation factor-like protein 4C [Eriocheir sinensis]
MAEEKEEEEGEEEEEEEEGGQDECESGGTRVACGGRPGQCGCVRVGRWTRAVRTLPRRAAPRHTCSCWGRSLAGLVAGPPTLVLVGLDSSGKTTALLRLKYGHYVNAVPTVGFNCECLRGGGCSWVAWDVGGDDRVRTLWRAYTRGADAVLFVVDASSGEERLEEARHELHVLVRRQAAQSAALRRSRPPLLVLANKQDLPGARTPAAMADALGLHDLPPAQPWGLAPACAVTGEGLPEAMDLLRRLLLKARRASLSRG